jgi:hypothetical protein
MQITIMIIESLVENATQDWLKNLGYAILDGPGIAPGEPVFHLGPLPKVIMINSAKNPSEIKI